jgi:hypothetical protein
MQYAALGLMFVAAVGACREARSIERGWKFPRSQALAVPPLSFHFHSMTLCCRAGCTHSLSASQMSKHGLYCSKECAEIDKRPPLSFAAATSSKSSSTTSSSSAAAAQPLSSQSADPRTSARIKAQKQASLSLVLCYADERRWDFETTVGISNSPDLLQTAPFQLLQSNPDLDILCTSRSSSGQLHHESNAVSLSPLAVSSG